MYALVDCNNFYVSCERVFNPALRGKPVIVLSNNDGCAISRSDEAKALGIEMGAVPHLIPHILKLHEVHMFSSNYTLYGDMSDRVMKIIAGFVPRMEIYSIDETFLDLGGMVHTDLFKLGRKIKITVQQKTDIPVCVGIAPTKALAKMANRYAKKRNKAIGVHLATSEAVIKEMLEDTNVKDVWGIGGQYSLMLIRNGIKTAKQFVEAPQDFIRSSMSVVGLRLQQELKGIPCLEWEFEPAPKKNIGTSRSFGKLSDDKEFVKEALSNFAANVALKLRQEKSVARAISIFVTTNPHRTQDNQYYRSVGFKMENATNATTDIIKYALRGLDIIFKEGYQYMKCGLDVSDLIPEEIVQLNLFSVADNPKQKKVHSIMDKVNKSLGKEIVRFGIQGFGKNYRARAAHLSPCYTTRLSDILKIKI